MNIIKVTSFIFGCAFAFFVTQSAQGSDVPQFPAGDSNPPVTSAQTSGASGRAFPPLGPLPPAAIPAYNPQTRAKIDLGKKLYFDPRLSGNNWISCATCTTHPWVLQTGYPGCWVGQPPKREAEILPR